MGSIIIQKETTENPIWLMGKEAGVCWGADTVDYQKQYDRGVECLKSNHGRLMEFPQVYFVANGYSARVIRELYTHIGGGPTRLQASTRYIDYENDGFKYVTPDSLDAKQAMLYHKAMHDIMSSLKELTSMGVAREDVALLLPLGMKTKCVVRTNLRNLVDMSRQRLCTRAYWEFRELMTDLMGSLSAYSPEWKTCVENLFKSKCEAQGYCTESRGCGKFPQQDVEWK